ncbi:MAG: nucleotidyl transferase AbiEii/AbiGii toxin family protein [Patescibacteria group bacterium]
MLTRQQLEIINRKTLKYPLHIAEKDYFLALILKLITESSLGNNLVFKGGTALHHCYLDQCRFSEDLDFSSNQKPMSLEEVRKVFASADNLDIKKDYLSDATIKIEKLQYFGPLIQPNSLKVEIDYLQNVLLPVQNLKYNNVWGVAFSVGVMDIREIAAEKIRAMSSRARYRDFYDLFLILEKYRLNLNEIVGYIGRKEIRQPIAKANIKSNWSVIGTQKEMEMNQIFYLRQINDKEIEALIESLPFDAIDK